MADVDIVVERTLSAPPDDVFGFLTDAARYTRWMGRSAELDPRPGGIYRVAWSDDAIALGRYVEVEPPRRIVFTWGWVGNDQVPPGSSTVEITLSRDGTGTHMVLRHSDIGLPEQVGEHAKGWEHYLDRLAELAAGGSPPPEP
jgi:uncharacterized protein YndB with AHSA1/START domain